ncbi:MAG: site-specific DNA-methyltransferase, partial [Sphingobium sp.]
REGPYIDAALERIASALPLDESALTIMQSAKSQPRVAFGTLVETGYIEPGTIVTDSRRRWRAIVRADGSLAGEDGASASIHKLGATLQGAPSCNGWTFWHYEGKDGLQPIDSLRQTYLLATQP